MSEFKCFSDLGDSCAALRKKDCSNCVFRKTPELVEIQKKKTFIRISALHLVTKTHLRSKYKLEVR